MNESANKIYTYNWLHTPTGQSGTRLKTAEEVMLETRCAPWEVRVSLLRLMNGWNRLGAGMWVYWLDW